VRSATEHGCQPWQTPLAATAPPPPGYCGVEGFQAPGGSSMTLSPTKFAWAGVKTGLKHAPSLHLSRCLAAALGRQFACRWPSRQYACRAARWWQQGAHAA
jgi:hypothetical protein